jgi:hypothetical protein
MIDRVQWSTGACVGNDDAATATGYSPPVRGKVLAVYVDYTTAAANPDYTLVDEDDPASENIANLANQKTDIKIYPRRVTEKNDGTDILYAAGEEVFEPYVVHGRLAATLAQADADDTAVTTVWIER